VAASRWRDRGDTGEGGLERGCAAKNGEGFATGGSPSSDVGRYPAPSVLMAAMSVRQRAAARMSTNLRGCESVKV
jgi:hypothetical protein